MLKKYFLILGCLCGALALWAQVSFVSVVDEDKHTHKEDFWHTFEYYIIPPNGKQVSKCQATRIGKNWFATAAHCVADRCKKGCTLRMDLLEQPISIFISAQHTPQKPLVFIHPLYNRAQIAQYDVALLHLKVADLPARYYQRPSGKETLNTEISKAAFQQFIKKNVSARREFNSVLHPKLPPILVFDNVTKRIDRKLSVISIFDGKRSIVPNPYPTDYVKELGFAYTTNFGVRQGMSGSGVMTNTGELAGIISGYVTSEIKGDSKSKENLFTFPVFNQNLLDFMEQTMGSDFYKIDRKNASPDYVVRSPKDHTKIISLIEQMQQKIN